MERTGHASSSQHEGGNVMTVRSNIKNILVAATLAVGLVASADPAEAQFRGGLHRGFMARPAFHMAGSCTGPSSTGRPSMAGSRTDRSSAFGLRAPAILPSSPCFVMPARRSLPPLEFCRGTSPIQAARFRSDRNALGSGIAATSALASSGPTPGTSISLRPVSVARALALIRRSISRICSLMSPSCAASIPRALSR